MTTSMATLLEERSYRHFCAVLLRSSGIGAVAIALLSVAAPHVHAHGVGTSQIVLELEGGHLEGEWELHLQDAQLVLGLDSSNQGEKGFAELQRHEEELRARLARSLEITGDSLACPIVLSPTPMQWDAKWDAIRIGVAADCPSAFTRMGIHVELLFDLDPRHRTYFSVKDSRATSAGALRADLRSVTFTVKQFHARAVALEFVREGISHIWNGLDHVLFLIALLLPAALVRRGSQWDPRQGFASAWHEVLKVVTAFTLAHSLTLALSFFGVLRPPSRWIEVGIAVSVFAASWNNLRPFLPGRAWVMAFGFGLVHGLGFAGVLNNLSLPHEARILTLAAFNVGVELGQLAIVGAALPLLFVASRRAWFPRFVMGIGSLLIAWIALVWALERAFSLSLWQR